MGRDSLALYSTGEIRTKQFLQAPQIHSCASLCPTLLHPQSWLTPGNVLAAILGTLLPSHSETLASEIGSFLKQRPLKLRDFEAKANSSAVRVNLLRSPHPRPGNEIRAATHKTEVGCLSQPQGGPQESECEWAQITAQVSCCTAPDSAQSLSKAHHLSAMCSR